MKNKLVFLSIIAMLFVVAALFVPNTAKADLVTYLNKTNEAAVLGPGTYATVTLSVSGNVASFNVDANNAFFTEGDKFGIQEFWFNTDLDTSQLTFTLPSGWAASPGGSSSGFGLFIYMVGDAPGTGNDRYDPVNFSVTYTGVASISESNFYQVNSNGYHYAAHIADFVVNGSDVTSAKFTDVAVPEPSTLLLLGFGIMGAALTRRLSKN